ncbi:hypothetical protein DFH09DRAFT_1473201 [Mycena vulgaris]|nr:hypothetical protein DFH09DRAFT_1473201 [Mycena vulgaris]
MRLLTTTLDTAPPHFLDRLTNLFIKRIQTLPSHDYAFLLTFSNFSASSGTARLARPPAMLSLRALLSTSFSPVRAATGAGARPVLRANLSSTPALAFPRASTISRCRPLAPFICAISKTKSINGIRKLRTDWLSTQVPARKARVHRAGIPRAGTSPLPLPRPGTPRPIRSTSAHAHRPPPNISRARGLGISPRAIAVTPAPRSPSSHHPRPAHKRPTRTRTAHRIRLPMRASFAPSPSQHAHMSLTALLHPASTGTWRLRARPLARYPRASLTTSPATSTRVREPDATPRALPAPPKSRCSLYLHPVRTRLAHDIPRRMSTDASPCGLSAPPAPRSFLLVPGPRRERKESLLRRPHLERRARTPHRGRLALALAPPAVAASSTARARGRGALAWYPNRRPRTGTTRAACLCE